MGARTPCSGNSLTDEDAATIKGMLERGDRQHDIAAWFGVNGGRIAEISSGAKFNKVHSAATDGLPPPGPYPGARVMAAAKAALDRALAALAEAETEIWAACHFRT